MMPGETEMSVTVNVSFELEEADCGLPRALVARAVGKRPGPSPAGPFDRSAHRAAPEQIHDREQNDRAEQRDQERAKREAAREDGRHAKQWRQNKSCQKRAEDLDKDIQKDALIRTRPPNTTSNTAQKPTHPKQKK